MGAAEGALSVGEGAGGSSPPPRLAALALARAGSGRRGTPDICREVFEELVADGHVAAAAAAPARAGRRCRGCPLVRQSILHNNPLNIVDLGVGVMGCRGFHSSFQATHSGLSLNTGIFIANTVKPDFPLAYQMVGSLNKTHWAKAENEVNYSRIKTSPTNTEYKMVWLSERNCYEQMFSLKELEVPVYAYFVKNRGMELKYSSEFPYINVGKPKRPAYLPTELSSLVPLQPSTTLQRSPFVEKSRQTLLKKMSVLSDVMSHSSYGAESMLSACRVPIFQGFTQVAGRILQPPKVYSWINQNHLSKEGIILIIAWCFYKKNTLGAHHGLISTYALATLVLYIFDVINNCFTRPEVLHMFMEFFSKFDCEKKKSSLWEPVSNSYLPNATGNFFIIPSAYSFGVQMLSNTKSSSKLIDLEGYRTKSASLMKMEGITSGKKRKKTSIEQPLDPPAEKVHIKGDEKVEEAVLPAAREKRKFTPIRRRIKIQDLRRQIKLGARSRFDAKE